MDNIKKEWANTLQLPPMFLGTAPFHELGDYKWKRLRTVKRVSEAVRIGYGIDCAVAYGNHRQVGLGMLRSGFVRERMFVTSKLYNDQQNAGLKNHYSRILEELGTGYLDLLLLHWPQSSTYIEAWKYMEELYHENRVRAIGMANVEIRHLEALQSSCEICPQVIQIERNPLLTQNDLMEYCSQHQIQVQSYAPLGVMNKQLIEHRLLKTLSEKYKKQPAQIILRWHIQTDCIPVVRSLRKERVLSNFQVWDFQLEEEEIHEISNLNQNHKHYDPRKYARYY